MAQKRASKTLKNADTSGTVPILPVPMLPMEIIFNILDYLKDDQSSLISCALVSRIWVPIARRLSAQKIVIKFSQFNHFIHLATSPHCSLKQHVHKLEFTQSPKAFQRSPDTPKLDMPEGFKDFAPKMAKIIRLLPHVTWLCLSHIEFLSPRLEFNRRHHNGFERIETLVLVSARCGNEPYTMEEIFVSFPNVRRLQCREVKLITNTTSFSPWQLSHYRAKRPSEIFLPELRELSIIKPDRHVLEMFNNIICLKDIRILELLLGYVELEPVSLGEYVLSLLLCEICPSLERFALNRTSQRLGISDYHLNPNMHTLTITIRHPIIDHEAHPFINPLRGINIRPIRSLILNIDLAYFPFKFYEWFLTKVFKSFDNDLNGLDNVIFNIRAYEDEEGTIVAVREFLDPGGGRGLWERGILKVSFTTKRQFSFADSPPNSIYLSWDEDVDYKWRTLSDW